MSRKGNRLATMQSRDEIAAGVAFLERYVRECNLSFSCRPLFDRGVHYFELQGSGKQLDFALSDEFLMDIPGTPGHQKHIAEYFPAILTRFENYSPLDFFSKGGTPFDLRLHWPFREHPSRDVLWCHADVRDIRFPDLVARTAPVISLFLDDDLFQFRPFARFETIVNAVRESLDKSDLNFYKSERHPSETQEIKIFERFEPVRSTEELVEQFLSGKVFWLAFKRGDKSTRVWLADPWDAKYLGVSTADLVRAAQVLQARGIVTLDPGNQFACPGEALLLGSPAFTPNRAPIGFQVPTQ